MNSVTLSGNVVRDPELRDVGASVVAKMTLAVNSFFKKADGTRGKDVTFVTIEAWDSGAKTIGELVKQGDKLLIRGELKQDKWTDKATNSPRSILKVRVSEFEHWTSRRRDNRPADEQGQAQEEPTGDEVPANVGGDEPF